MQPLEKCLKIDSIGLSTHAPLSMSHRNVVRGYIILTYRNSNQLRFVHSEKLVCFQCKETTG